MRRPLLLSLVVAALGLLVAPTASAQDATPTAATDRAAFVPAPAECVIGTLLPSVLNALATPAAEPAPASPVADAAAAPFAAPTGDAADAETGAAVAAVFRQAWACQNAGNLARYFSLLTEDEIRANFTQEEIAAVYAVPALELPEAEQTAVYAVLQVAILEDGRAGAFVVVDTVANPDPVEVNYMIAADTDGKWQIDDVLTFSADGTSS